jgi:hypothetical protein
MLDEINEEVVLAGCVAVSANAGRARRDCELLLAFERFRFAIEQTLEQVKIAKQGFVAKRISAA